MGEFDRDIRLLERRIQRHENMDQLTIFYGSSTIRLWSSMRQDLTPLNVLNLGFGGSHFDACIEYFDRVFHSLTPEQIVLYGGDNDLSLGYNATEIADRFEHLCTLIRSKYPGIPIYGITIKPSPHREDKLQIIKEANIYMKHFLKHLGDAFQIDTFEALLGQDDRPQPHLYLKDGLHLNKKGYEVWAAAVQKLLI